MNLSCIWDKLDKHDRELIARVIRYYYNYFLGHYRIDFNPEFDITLTHIHLIDRILNTKEYSRLVFFDIEIVLHCPKHYSKDSTNVEAIKFNTDPIQEEIMIKKYIRVKKIIEVIKNES